MNPKRFIALSAAGTVPICAVYAWAGARSNGHPTGIGVAVVLAFLLPAAGWALVRRVERRRAG